MSLSYFVGNKEAIEPLDSQPDMELEYVVDTNIKNHKVISPSSDDNNSDRDNATGESVITNNNAAHDQTNGDSRNGTAMRMESLLTVASAEYNNNNTTNGSATNGATTGIETPIADEAETRGSTTIAGAAAGTTGTRSAKYSRGNEDKDQDYSSNKKPKINDSDGTNIYPTGLDDDIVEETIRLHIPKTKIRPRINQY